MKNVAVIGSGSWGTALAIILTKYDHQVKIWARSQAAVDEINSKHTNEKYLPGVTLPETLTATTDREAALEGAEIVISAVPSRAVRQTMTDFAPYFKPGTVIVNVAKGVEADTLITMSQIIEEEVPQAEVAVLSGPSHAEEVGKGIPTTIVVGSKKKEIAEKIQSIFMNPVFRVYTSPDVLGIELGAALKNVVALAAGVADGLGYGDNTKAALITRGITEIARLGTAMGGRRETFFGLSGIGDLIVTCASMHSRNRRAGILIGKGYTMEEAMNEVKMVVEGVYSAKAALGLARKYEISMPIIEQVNLVLFGGKPAKEAVADLMLRDKKVEISDTEWE